MQRAIALVDCNIPTKKERPSTEKKGETPPNWVLVMLLVGVFSEAIRIQGRYMKDTVRFTSLEICSGAGGQALGLEMAEFPPPVAAAVAYQIFAACRLLANSAGTNK